MPDVEHFGFAGRIDHAGVLHFPGTGVLAVTAVIPHLLLCRPAVVVMEHAGIHTGGAHIVLRAAMDLFTDNLEQFFRAEALPVFLAVQGIACILIQLAAGYGCRQGHAHAGDTAYRQVHRERIHHPVRIGQHIDRAGFRLGVYIVSDTCRYGAEGYVHLSRDADRGSTAARDRGDDVYEVIVVVRRNVQIIVGNDNRVVFNHGPRRRLADGQFQRAADAGCSADRHTERIGCKNFL